MLTESALEFACPVHAYVLMTNHVHILTTPGAGNAAAAMMKSVGQNYVQYINRRYNRFGTLWQGRYRSCLVQEENYFLVCQRYIEMNPVRSGMAHHPREYEWSSYRANAEGVQGTLVTPHAVYLRIAQSDTERQLAYRALFDDEITDDWIQDVRKATNGNRALGSAAFVESLECDIGRDVALRPSGRRPC